MNFWDLHSIVFIIFMLFLPRLTMFFMGICFYQFAHPILFWFGWFFSPRLVIAIIATSVYWDTNPILCILAWLNALCMGSASTDYKINRLKRLNKNKYPY
jgi:hypothetical protein